LARSFLGDPSLLLLDEPNAGLDADGAAALHAALVAAVDRGAAVVLATHEPQVFAGLAARTVALDAGRVVSVHDAGAAR
jgi:ABC-type protease/lipase transport system fused ATPase/permease subunit